MRSDDEKEGESDGKEEEDKEEDKDKGGMLPLLPFKEGGNDEEEDDEEEDEEAFPMRSKISGTLMVKSETIFST